MHQKITRAIRQRSPAVKFRLIGSPRGCLMATIFALMVLVLGLFAGVCLTELLFLSTRP